MPPSEPRNTFRSFRILGEKAQRFLARAKREMQKEEKKSSTPLPKGEHLDEIRFRISTGSLLQSAFTILAIIIGTWFVVQIRDKIILILLSILVAVIIDPGVHRMEHMGIPRGLVVLIHYFFALFLFFFLLFSLIPIIASQLQQIAIFISLEVDAFLSDPLISIPLLTDSMNERLTALAQATLQDLSINQFVSNLEQLGQNLSSVAQGSVRFATRIAGSVLSFIVNTIIVLVMAFFIQLEKERLMRWFRGFFPFQYRTYMDSKSEAIHLKIAQWARGQLLLGLTIGSLVFIALIILGMPYAVTLAALAAFTEFIPYVGPFIAAVPAVLIALTQEGLMWALVIAGIYYVIQWCENNMLVPLIMKRAVGLSPIAIIFAMLVGISFPNIIHPILGLLLAVPLTTIIALFLEDWRSSREDD
ncbi:hypothetical protein A2635_04430 [Candidatus Peribacteria bacterium RIFCSPHIGHO2_01_FULL_51_9]|nr:MAG: hypothetical protein A2635_04430 [Candidatus Peribacteria bacterium RIFCSPHIGHO2_01_FULL_51_9]